VTVGVIPENVSPSVVAEVVNSRQAIVGRLASGARSWVHYIVCRLCKPLLWVAFVLNKETPYLLRPT